MQFLGRCHKATELAEFEHQSGCPFVHWLHDSLPPVAIPPSHHAMLQQPDTAISSEILPVPTG
jgi:hypothetical protein